MAGYSCTSKYFTFPTSAKAKLLTVLSVPCSNNSIEVNLLEICEKERFQFDQITAETTETDSNAGKIAADLQMKTFKLFQRKR